MNDIYAEDQKEYQDDVGRNNASDPDAALEIDRERENASPEVKEALTEVDEYPGDDRGEDEDLARQQLEGGA
jgi:hypothetical protein